jgi:hypothetical protein
VVEVDLVSVVPQAAIRKVAATASAVVMIKFAFIAAETRIA